MSGYQYSVDLAGKVYFNHMTKFWGIGAWLYPDASFQFIGGLPNYSSGRIGLTFQPLAT